MSDKTTVRIGLGEIVSTPGTSNGRPAVIIEAAPKPGLVGHDANLGKDLLPGAIVLEIHDSSGVQVLCEDIAKAMTDAGLPVPFRMV